VQMPAIGEVMFGFKNTNDNFSYTQMTYAIYFYSVNSGIGVYEDGTGRGWTGYTYTPGAWYDLRVELKNPGARYYYRPAGTTDWLLVYDSTYSSVTEFYTGLVVTGATVVDNYKLTLHGQKPAARYSDSGVYPVTLTVSDRAGQTATATSSVTITKGLPPVAEAGPDIDLDESQVSGGTWLVLLDGSESTDDYGIYRYDWDFGDGATDSGVMTTHVYSTPGAYTVTLTVWDHALQSSTDTMTVTVTPGEPPVAEAGPDVAMEECDAVSGRWLARFDGSASTDDHWIVRWEWDFGDGQTASGEVVTHVYKAVGEYEVTLTVYDDIPQSDSDTLAVSIEAGEAPEADPGGPYSVQEEDVAAGQALALFDASGSTDDCSIIHYIWDFGTETFDGVYLDKKLWDCSFQIYPGVYGDYVSIWGESWGNRYLFTAHAVDKEPGLTVQARLNESGNTMIGFKHADNQNYSYTDMPYALYLSSGGLHVYEDGAYRVNTGYGYAQSVWYDYKVVINDDGGADYFYKEADAEDWTLVYHSTYVSGASLKSGVVVNDNVCHIDDFRLMAAGRTVIYPVRRPGTVTLTVEDNARQSSTSTAEVSVLGSDAPVADPGGPYTAVFELPVAFDGTRSTDDMGVVKYIWDFGDGSPFGSGPNPEHAYAVGDAIGSVTKTVTLTVYDAAGQSDTQTTTVVLMPGPIVVCVPWQFTGSTEVPHRTWSGKEIRLKGTVKGGIGTLQYTWDFGDGSPATEPATVTDKFVIETAHTYTGTPGTLFTARLTVKDSLENTHHDTYPVVILEDVLDTRVDVAIDEGLWWLHKNQTRAQGDYWDGRIYTYGYPNSETGSAMQAFLINGHKETGSEREDPYVDTVKRGMRMLFRQLAEYSVYSQTYGDPDYPYDGTGNHIGLVSRWSSYMPYEGGMIMDGIVASGTPNRVAWAGNANVAGRTYKEILQDMVDAYAWGQSDNSDCGGGWRYGWNEWPDNSACQWAAIGMIPTTQAPWHCVIPQWVRNRNNVWLSYSYSPENRWFGYTDRGGGNNGSQATRPSGMVQMVMSVDNYKSDSRWIGTEGWFAEAGNWDWFMNCRSYYAWYAFVKAMRLSRSETLSNGFNWFRGSYGVAEKLVGEQESDGTWIEHSQTTHPGNYYDTFVTAWSVIMLTPSLFVLPPVADAGSDVVWKCGLPLTFDGSGSYHLDPTKRIVLYEWDFDGDGVFDYSGDNPVASHTFECVLATYTATLRVTDNEGETDSASRRVTISTEGHAPFAVITVAKLIEGKGVGTAGMPVTLDGTASFDIDDGDTITRYDWVFDGSAGYDFDNPDSTDAVAHAVYETPGTYHVGLRVWDNGVETPENTPMPSVPAYLVIVIDVNEPPSAEAGGPYSVDEGKTLELSGNGSDPNRAEDPLALAWDFDGDGEFDDGVGPNPSASWTGNGTYMVTLQVSDGLLTATDTAEVTVNDLSPTVDFSWSANPAEGSPALFTDASAPAVDAITGWHWDFAGLGASDEQNPSFAFPDDGDYDVTLTVYDTDSSASLAKTVHVAAVGPTANDDSPRVVQDLGAAEIDVLANDTYLPGPAEVLTVVGKTDGQHGTVEITGGGTALSYTPSKYVGADAFTYTIADEDGVHSTATVHVLVYLRGDADFDCAVTLLDLLLIRNKLNQNVGTGENWRADVNGDGRIDILDLLYTRNRINSKCK